MIKRITKKVVQYLITLIRTILGLLKKMFTGIDPFPVVDRAGKWLSRSKVVQFYLIYNQLFCFLGILIAMPLKYYEGVDLFRVPLFWTLFGYNIASLVAYNNILWKHKFCSWSKLAWSANCLTTLLVGLQKVLSIEYKYQVRTVTYIMSVYFLIYIINYMVLEVFKIKRSKK